MTSPEHSEDERQPLLTKPSGPDESQSGFGSSWIQFRKPSAMWLLPMYTLYAITAGSLIIPEFNATLGLICHQRHSPDNSDFQLALERCDGNTQVQSDLSQFYIYGTVLSGILGAIAGPNLMGFSDKIGRKPILLISVLGPLIADIIVLAALHYPDEVDVKWLLVGYAMDGLSGSIITATTASQAYISDISAPEDRVSSFSYIQAAFTSAFALGPLIAGGLLSVFDSLIQAYWLAFTIHLSLIVLFTLALPESLKSTAESRGTEENTTNQPKAEAEAGFFEVISSARGLIPSDRSSKTNMYIVAVTEAALFGVSMGLVPLQLAYSAYMFHWRSSAQSAFLTGVNLWSILVLVAVVPLFMSRIQRRQQAEGQSEGQPQTAFGPGELGTIRTCLLLQVAGYITIAVVHSPLGVIAGSLIAGSGAPLSPTLTSCLTKMVPEERQGVLLGAVSFLHAISRILLPSGMNYVYGSTVGTQPYALFALLGFGSGIFLVASMFIGNKSTLPDIPRFPYLMNYSSRS
uniref:MFS-type transporter avaJ n=1 Tax=Aspergillus versicolor TaxID=46472 RepID=AVAJ_ASPVE|nr:AvaJ [Aspergillus versicolor]